MRIHTMVHTSTLVHDHVPAGTTIAVPAGINYGNMDDVPLVPFGTI